MDYRERVKFIYSIGHLKDFQVKLLAFKSELMCESIFELFRELFKCMILFQKVYLVVIINRCKYVTYTIENIYCKIIWTITFISIFK